MLAWHGVTASCHLIRLETEQQLLELNQSRDVSDVDKIANFTIVEDLEHLDLDDFAALSVIAIRRIHSIVLTLTLSIRVVARIFIAQIGQRFAFGTLCDPVVHNDVMQADRVIQFVNIAV